MRTYRRRLFIGFLVAALPLAGCAGETADAVAEEPAEVEEIPGSELSRITLSAKAASRLGIETVTVAEQGTRLSMPYSAILYDAGGQTWTYASPEENVFVRHEIVVDRIDGDVALLASGPPAGTEVVTIGAAELYGTETGVGGGH